MTACPGASLEDGRPGVGQLDSVAHGGGGPEPHFYSLDLTDAQTQWVEFSFAWCRGAHAVKSAFAKMVARLPFPLRKVHPDGGSEFINSVFLEFPALERLDGIYRRTNAIAFRRLIVGKIRQVVRRTQALAPAGGGRPAAPPPSHLTNAVGARPATVTLSIDKPRLLRGPAKVGARAVTAATLAGFREGRTRRAGPLSGIGTYGRLPACCHHMAGP